MTINSSTKLKGQISWSSPSNIAFIKYWGKKEQQIPINPSLSMTLSKAKTITKIDFTYQVKENDPSVKAIIDEFFFNGEPADAFGLKSKELIKKYRFKYPELTNYKLVINSENTFPHSAGIASSASSMSALALCMSSLVKLLNEDYKSLNKSHFTINSLTHDEINETSSFARLGSGSACRSLFSHFSHWGKSYLTNSNDEYAVSLDENISIDETFNDLCDCILIVSKKSKEVSSTVGHSLMNTNPYRNTRIENAHINFENLITHMKQGDFQAFGEIIEKEALDLHALMMQSKPNFILMEPGTISIIKKIQNFRAKTDIPVYFTLDAGPNVHIIYKKANNKKVHEFIQNELLEFCHNGECLYDEKGQGPELLEFNITELNDENSVEKSL